MTRSISNLAELMTTDDAFTHVHMVFENYGSRRFIWMGHVLDDLELHYMLDMVMEEMGYDQLREPITVHQQRTKGKMTTTRIPQYSVFD